MADLKTQVDILTQQVEALTAEYHTNNFRESQDFNKYSRFNTRLKVPTYSTAPSTAEVGELYVDSDDGKLYVCTAADTWTLVGGQT